MTTQTTTHAQLQAAFLAAREHGTILQDDALRAIISAAQTTTYPPLTVRDALDIAAICEAAIHGRRVAWLNERGDVIDGIARSIGDANGNFAGPDDDIRGCYLRVSATFEHFLPVADLMNLIHTGQFVANYSDGRVDDVDEAHIAARYPTAIDYSA